MIAHQASQIAMSTERTDHERQRIAREIHDQLIQDLIGLNYQIGQLRAEPPANMNERLAGLQGQVRALVQTARGICADLRPTPRDLLAVVRALREITVTLDGIAPFHLTTQIEGDASRSIEPDAACCLIRVLQEALANAHKHAAAQHVHVRLHITARHVQLTICDDGVGFALNEAAARATLSQHFGLKGMRERAAHVGGELMITAAPGDGTCIELCVPCVAEKTREVNRGSFHS